VRLPLQADDERLTRWLPAGISLGCSSVLALWSLSYAPCIRPAQEWERAEERRASFLSTLEERIEAAPLEGQMLTTHIPMRERQDGVGTEIIGAQILMDYTVQAWGELLFPERELHVVFYGLKIPWRPNRTGLWIVVTLPEDAAERAQEKFMSEAELRERLRPHVTPGG